MKNTDVIVRVSTGFRTPEYRTVKTIALWEGNTLMRRAATEQLADYAIEMSKIKKANCIVTDGGEMYVSCDTPGYCDGDRTAMHVIYAHKVNEVSIKSLQGY